MNSRVIKIIAVTTMLIDHIGLVLMNDFIGFRIIGRLAMPLFCMLIAYGSTKTRSPMKYFLRLFAFAIISQLWLNLVIHGNVFEFNVLNVFFTLSLGALAVLIIKKSPHFLISMPCVLLLVFGAIVISAFIPIEYHAAGVSLIVLFYLGFQFEKFRQDKHGNSSLLPFKISAVFSLVIFNLLLAAFSNWHIQWFSMFAILFIAFFADKKLRISRTEKYAFYLFYPIHLTLLYIIKHFT